jgi:hypothetical protein
MLGFSLERLQSFAYPARAFGTIESNFDLGTTTRAKRARRDQNVDNIVQYGV